MRAYLIATAIAMVSLGLQSCAKKDSKEDSQLAGITQVVNASSELPTCSPATLSQVYWIEETSKLVVCDGASFVEVKGEKGEKGSTGDTGPEGSAANSGVWVFDAESKPVGVLINSNGLILFSNGGLARINLVNGSFLAAVALSPNGKITDGVEINDIICHYVETDCSGTCYQKSASIGNVVKGSIYRSNSVFYQATGKETLITGLNANSLSDGGVCVSFPSIPLAPQPMDAYPIAKLYSFPEGVTFPLQAPLSFGFKTED